MTAGGALITRHLVKGPLRFSPHPFGARLQAGCAPRAASGLTLDQTRKQHRFRRAKKFADPYLYNGYNTKYRYVRTCWQNLN
jgi:hypothetical protein